MTEIQGAENRDMYKSYIQKRRVVPEKTGYDSVDEDSSTTRDAFESESGVKSEKSAITDVEELSILREKYRPEEDFSDYARKAEEKSAYTPLRLFTPKDTPQKEPNIYRRYSSYNQTQSAYRQIAQRQAAHSRVFGSQSSRMPVEDNRTALLAIKIIKQALACFAVLGIIVLMQQNVGMADELSFVKKHVVENHIELDNIINGVKNIIAECSRFFGGSP
jgi:hypothetical protein